MRWKKLLLAVSVATVWMSGCGAQNTGTQQTTATSADVETEAEPGNAESQEGQTWTVLMYLCGADLESGEGQASNNLEDLSKRVSSDQVNFVIQTGGSSSWKNEQIDPEKLQRFEMQGEELKLVEEEKMRNMGDPETFADFLKWGVKTYPAEKYMVLLWDHGGGALGGACLDEVFNNSMMTTAEIADALAQADTKFELLGFDACLMASYEVATMMSPYANYMVASEEVSSGMGWNYESLGTYLAENPAADGVKLGRSICNSFVDRLEKNNEEVGATIALIDLGNMEPVVEAVNEFAVEMGKTISDVDKMTMLSMELDGAKKYADGYSRDLVDMAEKAQILDRSVTNKVVDAVNDAVLFQISADDYKHNNGLSMMYDLTLSSYLYDRYADICPSPAYLAYLDAMTYWWRAPKALYETTEKMPEPDLGQIQIAYDIVQDENKNYNLQVTNGESALTEVYYEIYTYDQEEKRIRSLANIPELVRDTDSNTFREEFDGKIASIGGEYCYLSLVEENEDYILYETPVEYEGNVYQLRIAYYPEETEEAETENTDSAQAEQQPYLDWLDQSVDREHGTYVVYGIWNSLNSSLNLPYRNVVYLEDGMEMTLLFPETDVRESAVLYHRGSNITYHSDMDVKLKTLSDGDYAMRYVMKNALGTVEKSDLIEIQMKDGDIVRMELETEEQ